MVLTLFIMFHAFIFVARGHLLDTYAIAFVVSAVDAQENRPR